MRNRPALLSRVAIPVLALIASGAAATAAGCTGDDAALSPACGGATCTADAGGPDVTGFTVASAASVTLVQGAIAEVELTITRTSFDGPITAAVSGLPAGVSVQPLVVPAGATSAKLTLSALATTAQGTTSITLSLSDAEGKLRRDQPVMLLVRGAAGALDTTFGNAGKVTTPIGPTGIGVRGVVVQKDGRILVGGRSDNDFVAARLDVNGILDPSYGIQGKVNVDLQIGGVASVDVAEGIALAPGGEAVLGGYREKDPTAHGIARVLPTGKIDTTFDGRGYATPPFAMPDWNNQIAFGVAVQPDGKALLAGTVLEKGGGPQYAVIARFKVNGAIDDTFGLGSSGWFYGRSNAASSIDSCEALALGPGDKIVAACSADDGGPHITALRLDGTGQPDTTFGPSGNGFSPVLFPAAATAHSVHVLADGRVLLAGESDSKMVVVRLDGNGLVDTAFGGGGTGKVTVDIGVPTSGVHAFVDASGRIVLAAATGADQDIVVARLTNEGQLDASFATTGFTVNKLGVMGAATNVRIAEAPDGRIVAVTNVGVGTPDLIAFRLWQ